MLKTTILKDLQTRTEKLNTLWAEMDELNATIKNSELENHSNIKAVKTQYTVEKLIDIVDSSWHTKYISQANNTILRKYKKSDLEAAANHLNDDISFITEYNNKLKVAIETAKENKSSTKETEIENFQTRIKTFYRILKDINTIKSEIKNNSLENEEITEITASDYHTNDFLTQQSKNWKYWTLENLKTSSYEIIMNLNSYMSYSLTKASNYRDQLLNAMDSASKESRQIEAPQPKTRFNLVPGAMYAIELNNGAVLQLQFRMLTEKGYIIFGSDSSPQIVPIQAVEKCEEITANTSLTEILESQRI